jgi:hypothetical protein
MLHPFDMLPLPANALPLAALRQIGSASRMKRAGRWIPSCTRIWR